MRLAVTVFVSVTLVLLGGSPAQGDAPREYQDLAPKIAAAVRLEKKALASNNRRRSRAYLNLSAAYLGQVTAWLGNFDGQLPGLDTAADHLAVARAFDRAAAVAPRRRRTEARRLIRKALAHKRAALRALPRAVNPRCVSKRIPYGSNVSLQTNGCAQPVSSIVYTASSKFSVFGNSILPDNRHAQCQKLNPRATRCFFNPALQPGASFFADITPKPNGPVSITTFNGAGQVVGIWTGTG